MGLNASPFVMIALVCAGTLNCSHHRLEISDRAGIEGVEVTQTQERHGFHFIKNTPHLLC